MHGRLTPLHPVRERPGSGFTLLELLVGMAILAILGLLVVLAFLGFRERAVDGSLLANARLIAGQANATAELTNGGVTTQTLVWVATGDVYRFDPDAHTLVWTGSDRGALREVTHVLVQQSAGTVCRQVPIAVDLQDRAVVDDTALGDCDSLTPPTKVQWGTPPATVGVNWVSLTWLPQADATAYRVTRIGATGSAVVGTTTNTTFTDSGLSPATAYTYQVTATRSVLEAVTSDPVTVTTLVPAEPLVFTVTTSAAGQVATMATPTVNATLVDWGDGSAVEANGLTHTYAAAGAYTVTVSADTTVTSVGPWRDSWRYMNTSTATFTGASSFGTLGLTSLDQAFRQLPGNFTVPSTLPPTVTNLTNLFYSATSFNQPAVTAWDTSHVTTMSGTFWDARAFNQPIGDWDTSSVTNMASMLGSSSGVMVFNQPVNNWNTANVTNTGVMFQNAKSFNQPLNSWDMSRVTSVFGMFNNATQFNQDLGAWRVPALTAAGFFIQTSGLGADSAQARANYASLLNGWSAQTFKSVFSLNAGSTKYPASAMTARTTLASKLTLTDGGIARFTVTTRVLTSNVATITTSAAHKFTVGQTVTVASVNNAVFNGTFVITAVPTSTTFSYEVTNADIASASSTGTATLQ